jgi:type II secretion system protein N
VFFSGKDIAGTGNAKLTLSECKIQLMSPVIPVDQLDFVSIDADITMNKQQLEINQCLFKGQQVDGTVSGSVFLTEPIGSSRLNLAGMVKPHHFFLADLKKTLPDDFLPRKRHGSSGFPIRLTGTFDKPGFKLR